MHFERNNSNNNNNGNRHRSGTRELKTLLDEKILLYASN
jgi:hypothetical protein